MCRLGRWESQVKSDDIYDLIGLGSSGCCCYTTNPAIRTRTRFRIKRNERGRAGETLRYKHVKEQVRPFPSQSHPFHFESTL